MDIKSSQTNTPLTTGQSLLNKASDANGAALSGDPLQDSPMADVTVDLNNIQDINKSQRAMANIAPFDQEKVEAYIQAIKEGSYDSDPANIADKMNL